MLSHRERGFEGLRYYYQVCFVIGKCIEYDNNCTREINKQRLNTVSTVSKTKIQRYILFLFLYIIK